MLIEKKCVSPYSILKKPTVKEVARAKLEEIDFSMEPVNRNVCVVCKDVVTAPNDERLYYKTLKVLHQTKDQQTKHIVQQHIYICR